jgi:hypothetical protein
MSHTRTPRQPRPITTITPAEEAPAVPEEGNVISDALSISLATDEAISEALDRLAIQQRAELLESGAISPETECSRKLVCAACFIQIGPGCYADEVWYGHRDQTRLCRGCAQYRVRKDPTEEVSPLASTEDLRTLALGPLSRELHQRSKALRRKKKG